MRQIYFTLVILLRSLLRDIRLLCCLQIRKDFPQGAGKETVKNY